MNIYKEWGFIENPFRTIPLPSTKEGKELLVGREKENKRFLTRLYNPPSLVTVEGLNGVGKTSLINVAIYASYESFFEGKSGNLFIPCERTFQLSSGKDPEEFIDEVLIEVAQTLIKRAEELENLGFKIPNNSTQVDNWINKTHIETFQGTLGPFGIGKSSETNTSKGFERSGFRAAIRKWLEEIFPYGINGGVVCIIDNLEILETSSKAKKSIEELRDLLFNFPGIRWVLCGALGIVKSLAATPRLEGLLHDPIEIYGIEQQYAAKIFSSRIEYSKSREDYFMPLTPGSFETLFDLQNQNIRNTLAECDQFCMYIYDNELTVESQNDKESLFITWLDNKSSSNYESVKNQLKPRALKLFKDIISHGDSFSPSDYNTFGFNSVPAMRPQIKDLEDVGVVQSSKDETDSRRKSIQLTSKGYFVSYAMDKSGQN